MPKLISYLSCAYGQGHNTKFAPGMKALPAVTWTESININKAAAKTFAGSQEDWRHPSFFLQVLKMTYG